MEVQSGQSTSTATPTSMTSLSSGSAFSEGYPSARDDFDPTMEETVSPVDLEAIIQTERITKILDECVYKTKLAICLPNLVKEFHTLSSILSSQNMDDLVFIFEQYDKPVYSNSFINMEALEDIKSGASTLKNRLNPELGHLMYIMFSYPALKPIVEEMVDKMKHDCQGGVMSPSLDCLVTLEQFRDLMVRQLSTTAAEELATKLKTKKLEAQNAKLIKSIKEKSDAMEAEKEAFDAAMEEKRQKIKSLQEELTEIQAEASKDIKKKILDSERQMVLASRVHAVKNDILQDEQAETTRVYKTLLATHVQEEKKLRARRLKVETQLLSWIKKYDLEMTDKQIELDDFQQKYDDEVRACRELEEKLKLQDVEYIPLMAEREEEYHREMKLKMEKFLLEHAARVIQSAWRKVLLNRAEKKKLWKLQKQQRKLEKEEAEKLRKKKMSKKLNKVVKADHSPETNEEQKNDDNPEINKPLIKDNKLKIKKPFKSVDTKKKQKTAKK
ncbi:dynein regulatory complex protein 10-like isoform X1 [Leguminivora glycinivorella]|uniref:dynein regulatory complex protein 10-like isoform X1 n=1 Tax=Leguminivora glycinivorella TaxID=1035111 RepID=UPI00200C248D|nr:dynein regulatory complex protein 10-like isoform X1 [Leguminivora glycinivorella]